MNGTIDGAKTVPSMVPKSGHFSYNRECTETCKNSPKGFFRKLPLFLIAVTLTWPPKGVFCIRPTLCA